MTTLTIILLILGLLWLAVSLKARWEERSRTAEKQIKKIQKAHALKNDIARDPAQRQRVRDHFDAP